MPVMRFSPGEAAPRAGSYELVLEWGERTGIEMQMQPGQQLPAVSVPSDGELWWVEREPTSKPTLPHTRLLDPLREISGDCPESIIIKKAGRQSTSLPV
jgi:hypothetical protein